MRTRQWFLAITDALLGLLLVALLLNYVESRNLRAEVMSLRTEMRQTIESEWRSGGVLTKVITYRAVNEMEEPFQARHILMLRIQLSKFPPD